MTQTVAALPLVHWGKDSSLWSSSPVCCFSTPVTFGFQHCPGLWGSSRTGVNGGVNSRQILPPLPACECKRKRQAICTPRDKLYPGRVLSGNAWGSSQAVWQTICFSSLWRRGCPSSCWQKLSYSFCFPPVHIWEKIHTWTCTQIEPSLLLPPSVHLNQPPALTVIHHSFSRVWLWLCVWLSIRVSLSHHTFLSVFVISSRSSVPWGQELISANFLVLCSHSSYHVCRPLIQTLLLSETHLMLLESKELSFYMLTTICLSKMF